MIEIVENYEKVWYFMVVCNLICVPSISPMGECFFFAFFIVLPTRIVHPIMLSLSHARHMISASTFPPII